MDRFPADLLRDIRELQRAVEQGTLAKGRPLTEASGGWILRGMGSPDPGQLASGDVWIYAAAGELKAMDSTGAVITLEPLSSTIGAAVADPTFGSSALGTGIDVNGAQYNDLREDVFSLYNQLNNLLTSLRDAGFISF